MVSIWNTPYGIQIKIGIFLGTELGDDLEILKNLEDYHLETIFGTPTHGIYYREFENAIYTILSRHQRYPRGIMPGNINYRANISAMKVGGCTHLISIKKVESLRDHIKPGDLVIPSDIIDLTYKRNKSFYDGSSEEAIGECRMPMEPAFAENFRKFIIDSITNLEYKIHQRGTVVAVEGPCRSSFAECNFYRQFGGDLISMTTSPESILAKELGMLYCTLGIVYQYAAWRRDIITENLTYCKRISQDNIPRLDDILVAVAKNISSIDWTEDIANAKRVVIENTKT